MVDDTNQFINSNELDNFQDVLDNITEFDIILKAAEVFTNLTMIVYLQDFDNIQSLRLIYLNQIAKMFTNQINISVNIGDHYQKLTNANVNRFADHEKIIESIRNGVIINYSNESELGADVYTEFMIVPMTKSTAFISSRDATKEIKEKQLLIQKTKRFEVIFNHSPLGIIGEMNGKVIFANPKFVSLVQHKSELEIIGQPIVNFVTKDQRKKLEIRGKNRLKGINEPTNYTTELLSSAGKKIPVEVHVVNVKTEKTNLFFSFINDKTKEKELRDRLIFRQKLDNLNLLIGGLTHDFNNLLMIINLSLEVIQNKLQDPELVSTLNDAIVASQTASQMANRIQNIGMPKVEVQETFDFYELIIDVKNLINISTQKFKEIMNINFNKGDYIYYGDPLDFLQVFLNLILNSIDAKSDSQEKLKISIEMRKEQSHLIIDYKDNGPGFNKELAENIFKPFVTTKTTEKSHLGLGMNIVYTIITEKYKGTIEADLSFLHGARFIINLPKLEL